MRTFAQQPKATQQIAPTKSAIFNRARFGQSRDRNSLLDLQRTIGNQAVQRLLKVNTGDVKEESIPEITSFGNVFNRTPIHTTERGKQLLAHELVHTMRQGNASLHRKIDFTQPQPISSDPIPSVLGGRTILGRTLPGFNGTLLPEVSSKKDYKVAVFNVLQPQTFKFSGAQNNEKTCKVAADNFNINVFAEVRAITQPQGTKWSGSYPPGILSNPPSVCANKGKNDAIQIEMEGKPDSSALYKKVRTHEQEHVTDLEKISTSELKPYHDFLVGITGKGKTDEDCVNDIFNQVGTRDKVAANEFVEKWLTAVQVYDKPGGTHHSKFETKVNPECTTMKITEKV